MNTLPIVHRELLLAARRRATYVSRSVVAGIVILLWLVVTGATARYLSTSELAKQLFWTYGVLAMLYALLCGVFFTADALSVERREGTLGLLFLTDLKGHDVVLGKLVATSWYGFHALLVILPILTLPLLMGGVSHGEMGRFIVLVLSTTFYSLTLGLLVSTICRKLVTVVAVTFLIVLGQCAVPWLGAALLEEFTPLGAEDNPLIFLCPFTSMAFLPDFSYRGPAPGGMIPSGVTGFWAPVVVLLLLGAACLVWTCWWLPRVWRRDEQPAVTSSKPPELDSVGSIGVETTPVKKGRQVRRRIEDDPCRWLALRQRGTAKVWNTVLIGLVCVWGCFLGLSGVNRVREFAFVVTFFGAFVLHGVGKGWFALESSRRFAEERQAGALELLLVTPVHVRAVIQGELAALKRQFALPMVLLTLVNVAFAGVLLGFDPPGMRDDRWWVAEIFLWGAVILWLDGHALMRVGMFTGSKARSHHKAALGTVLRVMVPPWAGVVLFFLLVMLPGGLSEAGFIFCMNGWFVLCALLDVVLILHMKTVLEANLRRLCAGEQLAYGGPFAESPLVAEPSPV
jgi:ABC-type transport system involved in multi-copper enzyme maturation permease subunit